MIILQNHQGTKRTVFSPTCVEIMDFFLNNVNLYFTPLTTALSINKSQSTIKDCMNLLKTNSYITKINNSGSVYHLTKENMEFWRTDFKTHVLALHKLRNKK